MSGRPWNFRFDLDEWNSITGAIYADIDRSLLVQGMSLGINGGPLPEGAPASFTKGWNFGKGMRDEVIAFKEKQSKKGARSAEVRASRNGTAQPCKRPPGVEPRFEPRLEHRFDDLSNPNHNPQSTIHNPLNHNPKTEGYQGVQGQQRERENIAAIYGKHPLQNRPAIKGTTHIADAVEDFLSE